MSSLPEIRSAMPLQLLQERHDPANRSFHPDFSVVRKYTGGGQVPQVHVLTLAEQPHDVPPVVRGYDMLSELLGPLDRGTRHTPRNRRHRGGKPSRAWGTSTGTNSRRAAGMADRCALSTRTYIDTESNEGGRGDDIKALQAKASHRNSPKNFGPSRGSLTLGSARHQDSTAVR